MSRRQEMIGKKFGRLVALKRVATRGSNGACWYLFLCDCGIRKEMHGGHVRAGRALSCGCLSKDTARNLLKTHGKTSNGIIPAEYIAWTHMIQRCENPQNKHYHLYGGRGISVCHKWRKSFEKFLNDMGPRPIGKSIERLDNNKGYFPENCYWATKYEQVRNRRNNVSMTHNGKTMIVTDWAKKIGMKPSTLFHRINIQKLPFEIAISKKLHR